MRFLSDAVKLDGDALKVSGRLSAGGRSIRLPVSGQVRRVEGELEVEAAAIALQRELGMTYSPLGMISPQSELSVIGYLIR